MLVIELPNDFLFLKKFVEVYLILPPNKDDTFNEGVKGAREEFYMGGHQYSRLGVDKCWSVAKWKGFLALLGVFHIWHRHSALKSW